MNHRNVQLAPGLYLVATPIGSARDITLRALDILASADMLVAEDTRTLRKLMDLHGIPLSGRRVKAYHDHSKPGERRAIVEAVTSGQSVAYASEAGTPLIADPGFALVNDVRAAGGSVTSAPGPSALITALSIAGLPTDRVHFAGFAPATQAARLSFLAGLADIEATIVLYEAPGRAAALFKNAVSVMGSDREAALCRELTKRFEEVDRSTLGDLAERTATQSPKGECVILIGRAAEKTVSEDDIDTQLKIALTTMRIKDAATAVAGAMGLRRRDVYQRALALQSEDKSG
ncbi:MAG: 16S rRNA (cytidine(1402)-2'-O)-methyltransferase [Pseudomonadota bacterium]